MDYHFQEESIDLQTLLCILGRYGFITRRQVPYLFWNSLLVQNNL